MLHSFGYFKTLCEPAAKFLNDLSGLPKQNNQRAKCCG